MLPEMPVLMYGNAIERFAVERSQQLNRLVALWANRVENVLRWEAEARCSLDVTRGTAA